MRQEAQNTTWLETHHRYKIILKWPCFIGRDGSNHVILTSAKISRRHALILRQDDGYWLVDMGSVNGVQINGKRMVKPQRLESGDRIEMPTAVFTFRQREEVAPEPTQASPAAATEVRTKEGSLVPDLKETVRIPLSSTRTNTKNAEAHRQRKPMEAVVASPLPGAPASPESPKPFQKLWAFRLGMTALIAILGFYFLGGPLIKKIEPTRVVHPVAVAKPLLKPTVAVARLEDVHTWTNSLGMKFVPAGTPNVLFSIWDVRVKDFQAYVDATHPDLSDGIYVTKVNTDDDGNCTIIFQRDDGASWKNPGFEHPQSANDPVVGVSWNDANAFCAWLTKKERATKKIAPNLEYRLPKDAEWTAAAGKGKYPWGDQWPLPDHAGNYCDQAFAVGLPGAGWSTFVLPENDGFAHTSPVGSFRANAYGLYDMGGNVWQWCEDWYQTSMNSEEICHTLPALGDDGGGDAYKVLRGGSWAEKTPEHMLSACRSYDAPEAAFADRGFRVVVARAP